MWKRDVVAILDAYACRKIENAPTFMRFFFHSEDECLMAAKALDDCHFIVERNPHTLTVRETLD